jgi:hypothetical protein
MDGVRDSPYHFYREGRLWETHFKRDVISYIYEKCGYFDNLLLLLISNHTDLNRYNCRLDKSKKCLTQLMDMDLDNVPLPMGRMTFSKHTVKILREKGF